MNKPDIEGNFEKAKNTYRNNAVVQKRMAEKLVLELLKTGRKTFDSILEIGAGTGLLTDNILKYLEFERIFLNDITENFTGRNPYKYLKGDFLKIPFEENSIKLAISGAAFQWIDNKEKLFLKLHKCLQKNGILAFSLFGEKNYSQIKEITGFGLDYTPPVEILKKTGFKILYFEEELETLYFKDMNEILNHIKLTGVGKSNGLWTKKKYETFRKEYLKRFSDSNGFELTYHPVYYIAEKI